MRKESRTLNASIFKTLNLVFPEVMVIPGSYNYYFAADNRDILTDDANILVKRWKEKKIRTIYFNELSIPHIVSFDRLNYVKKAVRYDDKTMVNSDFHPISYLYSIQIWLSYFPGLANIPIQAILAVKLKYLILWLFALAAVFKAASYRVKAVKDASIPVVIALIGSAAMILQLLTLYSFEAIYGYIYYMIGLLIAVFMGGLAAGSYIANNKLRQIRMDQIIALLLLLTAAFALFLHSTPELDLGLSKYLIPIFSFLFAVLVGAVFPAAVRDYRSRNLENKAGVLYGCDLLGGAFSAILTSLLFMPVFGIIGTISVPISLCLISLLLLFQSSS